jgi:hypothetical protein
MEKVDAKAFALVIQKKPLTPYKVVVGIFNHALHVDQVCPLFADYNLSQCALT